MAQVSVKIDWITATYIPPAGTQLADVRTYTDSLIAARKIFGQLAVQDIKLSAIQPSKHYHFTWKEIGTGITLDLSGQGSGQGFRLTATGQNLTSYGDATELVMHLRAHGWRLTRVDVAMDVIDGVETVGDIAEAWRELYGDLKPYASSHDVRRNGEMFTIGSRKSNRYVRIYDKAKEQGVNLRWLRYEIELKGDVAKVVINVAEDDPARLLSLGIPLLGLPNTELAEILEETSGGQLPLSVVVPRVKSSKERWIARSVIPCLLRLRECNPVEYRHIRDALIEALSEPAGDDETDPLAVN